MSKFKELTIKNRIKIKVVLKRIVIYKASVQKDSLVKIYSSRNQFVVSIKCQLELLKAHKIKR